MNRVKKVSRLYEEARPEIDHFREVKRQSRRVRRAAHATHAARDSIDRVQHELGRLTVKELKTLAKNANIKGRTRMRREQLIEELSKI